MEKGDMRRGQLALALTLGGGRRLHRARWLRHHVERVQAERAQEAGVPLDGVGAAEQGVEVAGDDGPHGLTDSGMLGAMRIGDKEAPLRVLRVVQL